MLWILNCLFLLLWSLIALLMALLLISLYCCFTLLSILLIRSMNALISSSSSSSFLRPFFALGKQDQATAFLSLDSLVVPLVTFSSSRFPPTHLWLTLLRHLPPFCRLTAAAVVFPSASLCSLSAAPPATLLIPCYCSVVTPIASSSMPASSYFWFATSPMSLLPISENFFFDFVCCYDCVSTASLWVQETQAVHVLSHGFKYCFHATAEHQTFLVFLLFSSSWMSMGVVAAVAEISMQSGATWLISVSWSRGAPWCRVLRHVLLRWWKCALTQWSF